MADIETESIVENDLHDEVQDWRILKSLDDK